ncbi:hypothetical protein H2201_005369 [Coniosporium apollinis]|uniref:Heterokaryon incompatibility domain-containing protein n=1 Tax=Coniosporium apollinis TaxID=61459 RepID=A0ABQ9NQ96_9PEZI|nr:hypothetical protein H2201_005369 [Coniosporium apollinis]
MLKDLAPEILQKGGVFWVDAVCINQNDLPERSSQVRLMTAIFQMAQEVLAWLAPESSHSSLAIRKMQAISAEYRRLGYSVYAGDWKATRESIHPSTEPFTGSHKPDSLDELSNLWPAIADFLDNDWWYRAWITQEATAREGDQTFLYCGRNYISLETASDVSEVVKVLNHYPSLPTLAGIFSQALGNQVVSFHGISRKRSRNTLLLNALMSVRPSTSSDPRDKVYAALGLASEHIRSEFVIDYTRPLVEVYLDVARFVLEHYPPEQQLDFLEHIFREPKEAGQLCGRYNWRFPEESFPTWVPYWGTSNWTWPLDKLWAGGPLKAQKAYKTSGIHTIEPYIDARTLSVAGLHFDTISDILQMRESFDDFECFEEWKPGKLKDRYCTGETVQEAFLHTVVADAGIFTKDPIRIAERGFTPESSALEDF